MSDAKLMIDESDRYIYRIGWFLTEDDEFGAMLGDHRYTEAELAKMTSGDDRDCALAYLAAIKTEGVQQGRYNGSDCLWWESRSAVTKALRAIKAAVANADHPWPEWAVKAKAEGWTPPKGWKP